MLSWHPISFQLGDYLFNIHCIVNVWKYSILKHFLHNEILILLNFHLTLYAMCFIEKTGVVKVSIIITLCSMLGAQMIEEIWCKTYQAYDSSYHIHNLIPLNRVWLLHSFHCVPSFSLLHWIPYDNMKIPTTII